MRITKIMKILEFHKRIKKIIKSHRIQCENHEHHENLIMICKSNENHENPRSPCEDHENYENLRIPSESYENYEKLNS